ncbi:uncharacterized protein RHOBADRAFT_54491 [Rhodotorula graminis WP1]|uniref:F-box domain-containing protein n=1 Tax=Rhodotorula graminis (strain WP1) TaxID=578459 RepID=A0A0P9EJW2_RHOGW|nr:uncharacterized protein RHOBADRAFT_54491 [Rhodotorula graminis WP1]KPV73903.1 hypothetical protein RHOBADRAFT_54491 [Rhodotorula graminis WP1]
MDNQNLISSSSSPPPILRLSNELLDTIFSLAYDNEPKHWAGQMPVCRRLLSFHRAQLYRRVQLRSYAALKSFHRTVVASSSIAELVRHVEMSGWRSENVDAAGAARGWRAGRGDDEGDCKLVTPVEFAALVPRMVHLESLKAYDLDPALVDVVFLDQAASSRLASLKEVDFSCIFDSLVQDGCDVVAWVRRLACLPRLADLTLCQTYQDDPILPAMPVPPTFPRLERLVLEQGLLEDWPGSGYSSPALSQMAPSLVHLELRGRQVGWFASTLASAPVGLRILSLASSDEHFDWDHMAVPINTVLARFKTLEQLFLCRCAFDTSLPSSIADLVILDELVYLSFEDDAVVPDAFLAALLANPCHLPNLETLELNNVRSRKGRTVDSMRGAIPPFETRREYPHWPMWDGWTEPEYPDGSTRRGLTEVWAAANERGIALVGQTRVSFDWQAAFEAEQRVALLALGDLTGDYKRARSVLGAEAVNAHILARSRKAGGAGRGGEGGEGGEA